MEVINKKKNKLKKKMILIMKIIVGLFIFYIAFLLIGQQVKISSKKKELEELNEKLVIQQLKNEELKKISEATNEENLEYIESVARESLGFSKKGEKIFVNVAGN